VGLALEIVSGCKHTFTSDMQRIFFPAALHGRHLEGHPELSIHKTEHFVMKICAHLCYRYSNVPPKMNRFFMAFSDEMGKDLLTMSRERIGFIRLQIDFVA
jgi:hypothetical protein